MSGRSVWCDAGTDPDPAKLADAGITVPFLDARWVGTKADPLAYLKWVRGLAGMTTAGLYLCDPWQWTGPPTDPEAWADWAYDLVQHRCAPGTGGDFPRVDLNYEHDDPEWLVAMLRRWRAHSPRRTTAFVVQAHKASIYAPVAAVLNTLRVTVKPECWLGEMVRVESSAELEAWQYAGVALVEPMLDAKQLGAYWMGTAFTMGRLP